MGMILYTERTMADPNVSQTPCPSCGGIFAWDAAAGSLRCGSCGEVKEPPASGVVVEHDLRDMLRAKPRGRLGAGVSEVVCGECGATVEFPEGVVATRCSFCDSPQVLAASAREDRVQPESVIPFAVTREAATSSFKGWLGKLWFRPRDLASKASVTDLRGVYVPYWTFSADVTSSWTADAGYRYDQVETTTDSNGLRHERIVQKTRWQPARGQRHDRYDDHLVCASAGLPDAQARKAAGSFATSELVTFSADYLLGFSAESYAIDCPAAWTQAQEDLAGEQLSRCGHDVPGDTHRSLRATHRFEDVTVKHALLPIWIAAFRYQGKTYRFLVNGQSGKVAGDAPLSWPKVLLFVAVVIALAVAAYFVFKR